MIYNLDLFGKELRKMREKLNLTQKRISELAQVDAVTLRRIEYGKVTPQLDTLELLSSIFKKDLISLLLKYRLDEYFVFREIKNSIESKFDGGEFSTLHNEIKGLNILLSSTNNKYYKNLITQLILITKAVILYKNEKNYKKSLNTLKRAIKVTTPAFNLNNYQSFTYSSMEIRILMDISFVLNKLDHKEAYGEIMEFCIVSVNSNDELYPKICHNLAGVYKRNKNYAEALRYSNMGIKSCQENRNPIGLNLLYYGKGIAEFKLNKGEYMESLKTSIYLCKALG